MFNLVIPCHFNEEVKLPLVTTTTITIPLLQTV